MNTDYDVKTVSGIVRKQSELTAGFDLVADKANWKLPIDAEITQWYRGLVHDAVVHFTGSVPTFTARGGKLRVQAAGYYSAIGA